MASERIRYVRLMDLVDVIRSRKTEEEKAALYHEMFKGMPSERITRTFNQKEAARMLDDTAVEASMAIDLLVEKQLRQEREESAERLRNKGKDIREMFDQKSAADSKQSNEVIVAEELAMIQSALLTIRRVLFVLLGLEIGQLLARLI